MSKKTSPEKSTTILLVRHGTTKTTGKVLPGRKPGLHLSKKGIEGVERTAEYIAAQYPKAKVFCSPMERAQETAGIITKALGTKQPKQIAGLNECDFGSWTGRRLAELRKLKEWESVQNRPGSFRFPKGESFGEMQNRIVETLNDLAQKHPGQTLVAVSHADPIKVALGYFLGVPIDLFQRVLISPASVSGLILSKKNLMIVNVNMTL